MNKLSSMFFCVIFIFALALSACESSSDNAPDGDKTLTDGDTSEKETDGNTDGDLDAPKEQDESVTENEEELPAEQEQDLLEDGDSETGEESEPDLATDGDTDFIEEAEPDAPHEQETEEQASDGDVITETEEESISEQEDESADGDEDAELEQENADQEWETPYCKDEITLGFTDLPYSANGTTKSATNHFQSLCQPGGATGPDTFYSLNLSPDQYLVVTVEAAEQVDHIIYIVDECNKNATCLAYANDNPSGGVETLHFRPAKSSQFFIVVDSTNGSDTTDFQIDIRLETPGPDAVGPGELCINDVDCNTAITAGRCLGGPEAPFKTCALSCDPESAENQCSAYDSGCCKASEGLEGHYCHIATFCGDLGKTAGQGDLCATEKEPNHPVCDNSSGADFCLESIVPSYCSHYCEQQSDCAAFSGGCCIKTGGPVDLCLKQNDCPHECVADELIATYALPATLNGSLIGSQSRVNALACVQSDSGNALGGSEGGDYIYRITLYKGEHLKLSLTAQGAMVPILLLMRAGDMGCGWTDSSDACSAALIGKGLNKTLDLDYAVNEDGNYFIVVDSKTPGQENEYELYVEVYIQEEEPELEPDIQDEDFDYGDYDWGDTDVDGDLDTIVDQDDDDVATCHVDGILNRNTMLNGDVVVNASTAGSSDDVWITGCLLWQTPGPDRIYQMSLEAGDKVSAHLVTYTSGYNAALLLYNACGNNHCLAGSDLPVGLMDSITMTISQTGDYYLVVDSDDRNAAGAFELTVTLRDNADGDAEEEGEAEEVETACIEDHLIGTYSSLPYQHNGDTTDKANKIMLAPGSCPTLPPLFGPDQVYAIELSAGEKIHIELSLPESSEFDTILMVTDTCDLHSNGCQGGSDHGGAGEGESFDFTAPYSYTFYIVVDSPYAANDPDFSAYAVGSYALNVTAIP